MFWLTVLFLLAAGAGGYFLFQHLTGVVVWFANRTVDNLEVRIGQVHFDGWHGLEFQDLEVIELGDPEPLAVLPRVLVTWDWKSLRARRIHQITVRDPKIRLILEKLPETGEDSGSEPWTSPWVVGEFIVENGHFTGRFLDELSVTTGFEARFQELHLSENLRESTELQQVRLGSMEVDHAQAGEVLRVEQIEFSMRLPELFEGHLEDLAILRPTVRITPALLELPAKLDIATPGAPADTEASEFAPRIDRFRLTEGNLFFKDPSGKLPSLHAQLEVTPSEAGYHVAASGRVDGDWEEKLGLAANFKVNVEEVRTEQLQELLDDELRLMISEIRITNPDAPNRVPMALDQAELVFIPSALMAGQVESVNLQGLDILLDPALLELAGGLKEEPTVEATPGAELPPIVPRVKEFHLSDGRFRFDDPEGELPVVTADLAVVPGEDGEHLLEVTDLRMHTRFSPWAPFAVVPMVEVRFKLSTILEERRIDEVTIDHLDLQFGQDVQRLLAGLAAGDPAAPPEPEPEPTPTNHQEEGGFTESREPSSAPPMVIDQLRLRRGQVHMTDLGLGIPDVNFRIRLDMTQVPLTMDPDWDGGELEVVEINDLTIFSPLDPFVPVVSFHAIFVRFTMAELFRQELREITVINPVIYIGEDLFWYAQEVQRRQEEQESVADPGGGLPPFRIHQFMASSGRLVIAVGGREQLALPLTFETEASNIDLADFTTLQLQMNVDIPTDDYIFPAYQLELLALSGDMQFGLPPGEDATNIVNVLNMEHVRWRQFEGDSVWLSITYDEDGIYGHFGGNAYQGYLNGGFNFYWDSIFPWIGWVSGTDLQLGPVTEILAPQSFLLRGEAAFSVAATGFSREVERLRGRADMSSAGRLDVTQLDRVIEALPDDWTIFRRSLTEALLAPLREFDYDSGHAQFWYTHQAGELDLKLEGPRGVRDLEVVLHHPTRIEPLPQHDEE